MIDNKSYAFLFISLVLGLVVSFFNVTFFYNVSEIIIDIFSKCLKFISIPIIFLSVSSVISNVNIQNNKVALIFLRTLKYTLLTTTISAIIAMTIYRLASPLQGTFNLKGDLEVKLSDLKQYLLDFVLSNIIKMLLDGNVFAVVFTAIAFGFLTHKLEATYKETVQKVFKSFFELFMKLAELIIVILPFILWAFVLVFIKDIKEGKLDKGIYYYMIAVLVANFFQAIIVLPLFLRAKGLSPLKSFKSMFPALLTAFFSKSSTATMPMTLMCLNENLKVKECISSITVPLCTTINMNACAAFIYITVLFVGQSSGIVFTEFDYILWIFLAILGAIGNAGVPMGCFFMSSAFLVALGAPTYIMGLILPFYLILDMFETAINVWSDACVTLVVHKETLHKTLKT